MRKYSCLMVFVFAGFMNLICAGQTWDMATSQSEANNPFGAFSMRRAPDGQLMVVTSDVFWYPWFGPGWGIVGQQFPSALLPSDHGNHGEAANEMMIQPAGDFLARWTSPISGWVEIDFYFGQGGWNQTSQSGFKFYENGVLISQAYVPWPVGSYLWPAYKVYGQDGSAGGSAMTRSVQIGDTLDFVIVTDGAQGDGGGGSSPCALHYRIVETTPPAFYNLTMAATPGYVDSITPAPGVYSYVEGSYANISASNYANCPDVWSFDHWSGDGVENPLSADTRVLMTQNRSVTAVFTDIGEACFELTIQTEPPGLDAITPSAGTYQYVEGDTEVVIEAQRYINCPDILVFDYWQGEVVDPTSEQTSAMMDTDKTITAVFADGTFFEEECQPLLTTDLNGDCVVDIADFALFAQDWLRDTSQY